MTFFHFYIGFSPAGTCAVGVCCICLFVIRLLARTFSSSRAASHVRYRIWNTRRHEHIEMFVQHGRAARQQIVGAQLIMHNLYCRHASEDIEMFLQRHKLPGKMTQHTEHMITYIHAK